MVDEQKIKQALNARALQHAIASADLLERIMRSEALDQGDFHRSRVDSGAPVRPALWSRLRLGPKLELVAACILLIGMLGVAALRPDFLPSPGGSRGSSAKTKEVIPYLTLQKVTTVEVIGPGAARAELKPEPDAEEINRLLTAMHESNDDGTSLVEDFADQLPFTILVHSTDGFTISLNFTTDLTSSRPIQVTIIDHQFPRPDHRFSMDSDGLQRALVRMTDTSDKAALFVQCGSEVIDPEHKGYNAGARDCLWQSYQEGKSAEFATTTPTEEGDPITYRVRILSANQIEVERDATKDRFGDRKVTQWTCSSMDMIVLPSGKIAGSIARRSLFFRECMGGDSTEVHIPW